MSIQKKRALIFAAVCIVLGFVISLISYGLVGGDLRGYQTRRSFRSQQIPVTEAFTALSISAESADVRLLPSSDKRCLVEVAAGENQSCDVSVQNSTLTITLRDTSPWYDHVGVVFSFDEDESEHVTVYLPDALYQSLIAETVSGDVQADGALQFQTADLSSASGEIRFLSGVKDSLSIQTASGDVSCQGLDLKTLQISTTSGEMKLESISAEKITLSSTSGDLRLRHLRSASFSAETTSGELEAEDLITIGLSRFSANSGDIELKRCDAGEYDFSTTSGEIEADLLSAKNFSWNTSSGDVHIPASDTQGGLCRIDTVSGDVTIRIVG